jgi:hypothetical protein
MDAEPVPATPGLVAPILVALPGTLCTPAVFEPLAAALAGRSPATRGRPTTCWPASVTWT